LILELKKIDMKRVYKIDKLRAISNIEFIKMITDEMGLKDIAIKYDISLSQLSLEMARRDLFTVKDLNKTRKVQRNFISKLPDLTPEDEIYSKDSWVNSAERYSFVNAGLMQNKSLKYI